jgi:pimeloyl-ACP methyl ester carboxylesterase
LKTPPFLKEVYPFTPSRYCLDSGHSLSYLDEGKEDSLPTIFLHGNPTWSFYYRKAVLAWRELGRCIVPDHLGCGLSDKPSSKEFSYQLKDHANNIRNLINSLHIENFNLVMHDWGGAIGMTAFGDEPERVRKIVLLNTAAFPSSDVPRRILFCRLPLLGEFWVRAMNGFAFPATWMGSTKGLTESTKKGLLFPYDNWKNRIAIWKFVRDIPHEKNHPSKAVLEKTSQQLANFTGTPSMACWGMKDFCFHGGFLNEWKKRWPNLDVHRLEDLGHYLLEDSFEDVRSKVEPFLFES